MSLLCIAIINEETQLYKDQRATKDNQWKYKFCKTYMHISSLQEII